MRGQRMKRAVEAQEEAARESAATAEQECGAGASAAIEIIEHRESKPRRIPSRSWRELIKKVWEVDPLLCPYDIPSVSTRCAPCRSSTTRRSSSASCDMRNVSIPLRHFCL